MSHHNKCIRYDGDWICSASCTHDRDEANQRARKERDELRVEVERLTGALQYIAEHGGTRKLYAADIPTFVREFLLGKKRP